MSTDLGQQQEILGVRLDPPSEQQAAKVRELVEYYARDEQDQALLLDVLGLDTPAAPAGRRAPRTAGELCGVLMRGERVCGRIPLHPGPHRSKTAIEHAESRRQRAGIRPAERIGMEKPA